MSAGDCKRSWEAEASVDARLSAADRASFERHAAVCSSCSAEVTRLERLRAVAARLPGDESTPLEHRRQRVELLRRANGQVVRSDGSGRWRLSIAAGLAATVLVGGAFAALGGRAPAPTSPSPLPAPEVTASGPAKGPQPAWERAEATSVLPDDGAAAASAVRPPSAPPAARPLAVVSAPPSAPPPSSAASDLAAATAAFSDGDYPRAEALFVAFEQNHPNDARVEDARFSIAVARSRRGDKAGAREAAREYLRRYPTGFRHQEATRLAD